MNKCKCCGEELKGYWNKLYCGQRCAAIHNNKKRVNKKIEENRALIEQMMSDNETIQSIRRVIGVSTDTFKREYPDYKGNPGYSRAKKKQIKQRKVDRCQTIYEHIEQHGTTGLSTGFQNQKVWLKRYLVERDGAQCSECGWAGVNSTTGNVMTELDHIDGDKHNNHIDNCRILCPNCHSLTPTFRNVPR